MFAVLLAAIMQGVEHPGSVYSITPQWWHLMVLQYVAASFHLPSVSTANINTLQYTKPHKQSETPSIPAVVISKVLLPQSNIMAAFVHSHRCLLSDVSSGLQTYRNQCHTIYSSIHYGNFLLNYQNPTQNVQLPTYNSIYCSLNAYWSYNLHSSYNGERTGIN